MEILLLKLRNFKVTIYKNFILRYYEEVFQDVLNYIVCHKN